MGKKISEYMQDRLKYEQSLYDDEFGDGSSTVVSKPSAGFVQSKAQTEPPSLSKPSASTPEPENTAKPTTSSELLEQYLNFEAEPFKYDENADPLYQKYMGSYQKNAKAAAEESFARAAAASGGFGNSFAAIASQQAFSEQMDKADDVIPELYEYAYSRHKTAEAEKKQSIYDKYAAQLDSEAKLEAEQEAERAAQEEAAQRADSAYGSAYGLHEQGYSAESIRAALMANGYSEAEATAAVGKLGAGGSLLTDDGTQGEYQPGGKLNNRIGAGVNSILYTEDDDGNLQLTYDGSQKQSQVAALKRQGYSDSEIDQIFSEAQYTVDQTAYDAVGELERLTENPKGVKITDITESYATYKRLHDTGAISEDAWNEFYNAMGDSVVSAYKYATDNVTGADAEALGIDKATWEEYADDPSAQKELIYNAAAELVSEGVIHKGDMFRILLPGIEEDAGSVYSDNIGGDITQRIENIGKGVADLFSLALNYYETGALGENQMRLIARQIDSAIGGSLSYYNSERRNSLATGSDGVLCSVGAGEFTKDQWAAIQKYLDYLPKAK